MHKSNGFDNQFPYDSYNPRLLMHYSRIHSTVCPMKCDVSAQLTTEIITHLSNLEHEMKFHIAIQFKLLETNNIIDTDKSVISLVMILLVVWRKLHCLIKEASHIDGEYISENSASKSSSYVLSFISLLHDVVGLLYKYFHSCSRIDSESIIQTINTKGRTENLRILVPIKWPSIFANGYNSEFV